MNHQSDSHPLIQSLSRMDQFFGLIHVFARDRDSRIVYWGAGAQRLYGWAAPEALGRKSNELLQTRFPMPLDAIERIVEKEGSWAGNLTQTTRSGEVKQMASHWARYHQASDPDYCVFENNNDITQLFQTSAQLDEALKRAREAIATRDSFVASVAHELRTPLNAVLLAAQAARLTLASNREQTLRNLDRIVKGVHGLSARVERLLDSVRISSGHLELDKRSIDLVGIVRSAIEMMRPLAETRRIELRACLPTQPLEISGDAERLDESILNLLGNAIKFTPQGGHVDLSMVRSGDSVELTVCDDGDGIDSAFMPRLFNSMTKAPDSGHNRAGLGLGLFITKNVIELHGGEIVAFSDGKGRGATFKITLPIGQSGLDECPPRRPLAL